MTERYNHHRTCQHLIYRLSCEDMDELWKYARGRCQICDTPEAETVRRKLVIDHDPRYDLIAVRGLLCDKCNNLMGKFDADPGRAHRSTPRKLVSRCYRYKSTAWFIRALRDSRGQRLASRKAS